MSIEPDVPTLQWLLQTGLGSDGTVTAGFPLVLKVAPESFVFGADGILSAPLTDKQRRDHAAVRLAAALVTQTAHPVAFPTETVYGLGANATSSESVARVFAAKGRPSDNPLIVHVSTVQMALDHLLPPETPIPPQYLPVISQHWPGPLSILLPKGPKVPHVVTAGHDSVAVRMPSHPVARALISLSNCPIAAPSANTSTRPSPTLASHVQDDLKQRILLILDGGPCEGGLESTVLDALRSPPCVLRPGGVTVEMIQTIPGFENTAVFKKGSAVVSEKELIAPVTPGMKYKHYAPRIPVILFEPAASNTSKSSSRLKDLEAAVRNRVIQLYNDTVKQQTIQTQEVLVVGILRTQSDTDIDLSGLREQLLVLESKSSVPLRIQFVQQRLGSTSAEIGTNLFRALRELEAMEGCCMVFIEGVEEVDEGLAVMNRVRKAAVETIHF
ncbi:protein SUA5 [Obelidium mucronatum]|nr:protein SUA5 [Obelidium mucronatum]